MRFISAVLIFIVRFLFFLLFFLFVFNFKITSGENLQITIKGQAPPIDIETDTRAAVDSKDSVDPGNFRLAAISPLLVMITIFWRCSDYIVYLHFYLFTLDPQIIISIVNIIYSTDF